MSKKKSECLKKRTNAIDGKESVKFYTFYEHISNMRKPLNDKCSDFFSKWVRFLIALSEFVHWNESPHDKNVAFKTNYSRVQNVCINGIHFEQMHNVHQILILNSSDRDDLNGSTCFRFCYDSFERPAFKNTSQINQMGHLKIHFKGMSIMKMEKLYDYSNMHLNQ